MKKATLEALASFIYRDKRSDSSYRKNGRGTLRLSLFLSISQTLSSRDSRKGRERLISMEASIPDLLFSEVR